MKKFICLLGAVGLVFIASGCVTEGYVTHGYYYYRPAPVYYYCPPPGAYHYHAHGPWDPWGW